MKKHLSILFIVLVATAIFTSTVFAAPASKNVSLLSVSYNDGGVVLIFQTSGLTKADLKEATIYADSNWHKMYCTFIDDTTKVRCTVEKKLAGEGSFRAVLAGFGFWGELPQPRSITCPAGEIAFYSYNQYHNGTLVASGVVPVWIWDEAVANGFFDMEAKHGYTFEITGTFCSADVVL